MFLVVVDVVLAATLVDDIALYFFRCSWEGLTVYLRDHVAYGIYRGSCSFGCLMRRWFRV